MIKKTLYDKCRINKDRIKIIYVMIDPIRADSLIWKNDCSPTMNIVIPINLNLSHFSNKIYPRKISNSGDLAVSQVAAVLPNNFLCFFKKVCNEF